MTHSTSASKDDPPAHDTRPPALRGDALAIAGHHEEALAAYDEALVTCPDDAGLHANRGVVLQSLGRFADALRSQERALEIRADSAQAHCNRGNALRALGRDEEAVSSYDRALEIEPDLVAARCNRGVALARTGRLEKAALDYECALRLLAPQAAARATVCFNLGVALQLLGRARDAVATFDLVLAIRPDKVEAWVHRGSALLDLGLAEDALASCEHALRQQPDHAQAHVIRGNALRARRRFAEAMACYERALALEPEHVPAWCHLGSTLCSMGRRPQALACFERALRIAPDMAEAHCDHGTVLQALARFDEALAAYDRAIALRSARKYAPDAYPLAQMNRAILLLMRGAWQEGFAGFEWRWAEGSVPVRPLPSRRWNGQEDLRGKTLLIYHDEGLGDSIHFSRYAALAKARGAHVVLEVPQVLVTLLKPLAGVDAVVAQGDPLPAHDLHVALMSLAPAFGTTLETVPQREAYLFADEKRRAVWAGRLGERRAMRVGLAWSGNPAHKNDFNRSVVLSELVHALPPEVEYVSLQKELRTADERAVVEAGRVRHLGDRIEDFADTAALCSLMDVVVSVDTSVAHLAGALGRPTWILLPYLPDWRWLLGRTDSPWYASVTLYRQGEQRQWAEVIERVAQDLVRNRDRDRVTHRA